VIPRPIRRLVRAARQSFGVVCLFLSRLAIPMAIYVGSRLTASRVERGELRSLWGVTPILTLPLKARADRELGFRSNSIVYVTYVITAGFDIILRRPYLFANSVGLGAAFQRLVLVWALVRYDVFHFFADRGLLDPSARMQISFEELAALRAAGKRVYIYTYGADVRTRQATLALGRWNFCVDCTHPEKYCACNDSETEKYLAQLSQQVTAIVSLGDMLTYVPGAKHVHYWPVDLEQIEAVESNKACSVTRGDKPESLLIGHAPNHTHFKGSRYLEQVVERLKARGHEIDYVKIQGVPNKEVLSLFAKCDIVADQFIGGAFGYTALEAMALGKPVLSFVRSPDLVEAPDECPIINATPYELEDVILWVLQNREQLRLIGEQGRRYIQRWHAIPAVAARLGKLYQDTANFPPLVLKRIEGMRKREDARRNSIPVVTGWHHPFQVGRKIASERFSAVATSGS
jgi:glycosyltransferase involved in cell wall biosynthesis